VSAPEDDRTGGSKPPGGNGRSSVATEASPENRGLDPAAEPGKGGASEPPTREFFEALRKERDELKDQLLRRRADFENYKKRAERDRELAGVDQAAQLFGELIPTIDNLERALAAGGDEASVRAGVEMIYRGLLAVFEKHGVKAHDPTGQLFDPVAHQALIHEEVPGLEEGTVAEAFRKGYSYKERLLRPALVKVAKGEGGNAETDDDTDDDTDG
jgi:molecular chaperone GrpE